MNRRKVKPVRCRVPPAAAAVAGRVEARMSWLVKQRGQPGEPARAQIAVSPAVKYLMMFS